MNVNSYVPADLEFSDNKRQLKVIYFKAISICRENIYKLAYLKWFSNHILNEDVKVWSIYISIYFVDASWILGFGLTL